MALESRRRFNNILERLGQPFECGREVATNGNCFFDSSLAVAEDPKVRETLLKHDPFCTGKMSIKWKH